MGSCVWRNASNAFVFVRTWRRRRWVVGWVREKRRRRRVDVMLVAVPAVALELVAALGEGGRLSVHLAKQTQRAA